MGPSLPSAAAEHCIVRLHRWAKRKLEPDPGHPRYFITEPGSGIRFVPEGATGVSADAEE